MENSYRQRDTAPSVHLPKHESVSGAEAAKKPAVEDFLEMMVGPKVEFFVGEEKKRHILPKLLICHYSPVFERAFNGPFAEGTTQSMNLPEDTVQDFEAMVEYMLHGNMGGIFSGIDAGGKLAQKCINFLVYADKYQLGDISEGVYEPLKYALIKGGKEDWEDGYIETVFRVTEAGNPLRSLITHGAIAFGGGLLSEANHRVGTKSRYSKQEETLDGFAFNLLQTMRACLSESRNNIIRWRDPLTKADRSEMPQEREEKGSLLPEAFPTFIKYPTSIG